MIKIKVRLNNTLDVLGLYDSGSNVSLINSKILRLKNDNPSESKSSNLKTINGVKRTDGLITITAKIFNIEDKLDVFIVDNKNFDYDFLIGLDGIKKFRLVQNEQLEISQNLPKGHERDKNKNFKENTIENEKIENGKYMINFNEHIEENDFQILINHLIHEEKAAIEELIEKYKPIFAKDKYDIGRVTEYEARIDLLVDKYCSKRPYRCTLEDKKEINTQVAQLLKHSLVEESYSPFAAPVTLAFKKSENSKSRLCMNFQELNKIVVPQSQPFPLIEDLVQKPEIAHTFQPWI